MPYIHVAVTRQADPTLSREIATRVSALTATHLGKDPAITAVAVTYVDPQHWFAGGRSLAEQGKNTFWLDIKVVDGSNTRTEMAAYLEAVFATLSALLGNVHRESYALVHEVPAAAYGYAGKTQEYRFIARQFPQAA